MRENLFTCTKCEQHYNVKPGTNECPVCGHAGEDDYSREKRKKEFYKKLDNVKEDIAAPANSAGSGNIAGIGVGPQGEPGIKKRKLIPFKRYINNNGGRST
jgi:RecJ-like exonuclease